MFNGKSTISMAIFHSYVKLTQGMFHMIHYDSEAKDIEAGPHVQAPSAAPGPAGFWPIIGPFSKETFKLSAEQRQTLMISFMLNNTINISEETT